MSKEFNYVERGVLAPENQNQKRSCYSWCGRNNINPDLPFEEKWITYAKATGKTVQLENGMTSKDLDSVVMQQQVSQPVKELPLDVLNAPEVENIDSEPQPSEITEPVDKSSSLQAQTASISRDNDDSDVNDTRSVMRRESALVSDGGVSVDDIASGEWKKLPEKTKAENLMLRVFFGINRSNRIGPKYYIVIPMDEFPESFNFKDHCEFTSNGTQEVRYWIPQPANFVEIDGEQIRNFGRVLVVNKL